MMNVIFTYKYSYYLVFSITMNYFLLFLTTTHWWLRGISNSWKCGWFCVIGAIGNITASSVLLWHYYSAHSSQRYKEITNKIIHQTLVFQKDMSKIPFLLFGSFFIYDYKNWLADRLDRCVVQQHGDVLHLRQLTFGSL